VRAARAVDKAGLRGVLGETFLDFPVPDHKDLAAALAYMETFASRWKGHPRVVPAVAPHAPYTCSKETLLACRDFAQRHGLPLLIHVAETQEETKTVGEKYGKTPVALLEDERAARHSARSADRICSRRRLPPVTLAPRALPRPTGC